MLNSDSLGAELKRLVPSLVLMGLVFSRSSGLVPNAQSGDLREADKRHCNPHVLPFNHLSFERFDGYWVTAPLKASYPAKRALARV